MDYGLPKTLPATGAGLIAGTLTHQLTVIFIVGLGTYLAALLIRRYFRPGKKLNDK